MNSFTPLSIEDRDLYLQRIAPANSKSSGYSFGNVFLWDIFCRRNLCPVGERLCVEYMCRNGTFYSFPAGTGNPAPAMDVITEQAKSHGIPLMLRGVTAPDRELLESLYPNRFRFTADRDNYDYIYSIQAMATLSGKKLHGKRNHCNKFQSVYDWRYESLTPDRFSDCLALLDQWNAERDIANSEESYAIRRCFQHWDALDFSGGVLYADDRPVAFTIGERITEDTVDVHFEKALDSVQGAYPMVAREYARYLLEQHPELQYLNREEDMGIENLRKAKESWYPLFLLEKYTAEEV